MYFMGSSFRETECTVLQGSQIFKKINNTLQIKFFFIQKYLDT